MRRCCALHAPSPHVLLSRQRAEPSLAAHCVPRRLRTHIQYAVGWLQHNQGSRIIPKYLKP